MMAMWTKYMHATTVTHKGNSTIVAQIEKYPFLPKSRRRLFQLVVELPDLILSRALQQLFQLYHNYKEGFYFSNLFILLFIYFISFNVRQP
jgi:hypothetical protein